MTGASQLHGAVLVPAAQQSESATHAHTSPPAWGSPQSTALLALPGHFSLVICFIRGNVHMPVQPGGLVE